MKRLYGSEKNWFRGLGGLTVAITINTSAFKFSISTIMRNTSHANCTEDIVKVFLKVIFNSLYSNQAAQISNGKDS